MYVCTYARNIFIFSYLYTLVPRVMRSTVKIVASHLDDAMRKVTSMLLTAMSRASDKLVGVALKVGRSGHRILVYTLVKDEGGSIMMFKKPLVLEIYSEDGFPLKVTPKMTGWVGILRSGEFVGVKPCEEPSMFSSDWISVSIELNREPSEGGVRLTEKEKLVLLTIYNNDPRGIRKVDITRNLFPDLSEEDVDKSISRLMKKNIIVLDRNGRYHINYENSDAVTALRKICLEKNIPPPSDLLVKWRLSSVKRLLP